MSRKHHNNEAINSCVFTHQIVHVVCLPKCNYKVLLLPERGDIMLLNKKTRFFTLLLCMVVSALARKYTNNDDNLLKPNNKISSYTLLEDFVRLVRLQELSQLLLLSLLEMYFIRVYHTLCDNVYLL